MDTYMCLRKSLIVVEAVVSVIVTAIVVLAGAVVLPLHSIRILVLVLVLVPAITRTLVVASCRVSVIMPVVKAGALILSS